MTLELTTTRDLIRELERRYTFCVVLGSVDRSGDTATEIFSAQGDTASLTFLLDIAKRKLLDNYLDHYEPTDDTP